jgi:hypothetical protein
MYGKVLGASTTLLPATGGGILLFGKQKNELLLIGVAFSFLLFGVLLIRFGWRRGKAISQ